MESRILNRFKGKFFSSVGLFVLLLIISVGLIAGCSSSKTELNCPTPYTVVAGDCCLDMNENNVCDKNEVVVEKTILKQGSPVSEKCSGTMRLECISSSIGVDHVTLKMQSVSKDLIKVREVSLPGADCSVDFDSSAELRFNDVQEVRVPCKMEYTTFDSDVNFVLDVRNVKVKNTGEIYEISEPTEVKSSGHISGTVKL